MKEKGLAQWRLEQALLVVDNASRMTAGQREDDSVIFFRKRADERDQEVVRNTFSLEDEVRRIRHGMAEAAELQDGVAASVAALAKRVEALATSLEQ